MKVTPNALMPFFLCAHCHLSFFKGTLTVCIQHTEEGLLFPKLPNFLLTSFLPVGIIQGILGGTIYWYVNSKLGFKWVSLSSVRTLYNLNRYKYKLFCSLLTIRLNIYNQNDT